MRFWLFSVSAKCPSAQTTISNIKMYEKDNFPYMKHFQKNFVLHKYSRKSWNSEKDKILSDVNQVAS